MLSLLEAEIGLDHAQSWRLSLLDADWSLSLPGLRPTLESQPDQSGGSGVATDTTQWEGPLSWKAFPSLWPPINEKGEDDLEVRVWSTGTIG